MTVNRATYDHNRQYQSKRFEEYGPFYQAHCHWCDDMSDCYDTMREAGEWTLQHKCTIVVKVDA